MIGTGIFVAPADVARHTTGAVELCVIWILGALLSLLGALTVAEAASAMPATGGMMLYLERGLGRWAAYAFGWAMMVVLVPSSVGYFAQVASQYFVPWSPWFAHPWAKSVLVAVILAVNLRGVRTGARFQDTLTVLKILGILGVTALAIVCAFQGGMPLSTPVTAVAVVSPEWSPSNFAVALVGVLWAYDGWIDVTSVAGELRDPKKNIPFALLVGTLLVAGLYLAINFGFIAAFGHGELARHSTPAVDLGAVLLGRRGAAMVGVLVGVAALGACAVGFMSGVRVVFAAASRGLLFAPLGRVSGRGVPANALIVCALLAVVYQQSVVARLGEIFILGAWPFYALMAIAVIRMKRGGEFSATIVDSAIIAAEPSADTGYREREFAVRVDGFVTPWFPWPQRIFATVAAAIVLMYTVREPKYTAVSFAAILAGFIFWPWFRMRESAEG